MEHIISRPGTWSDDSSMAVATMEWLGEMEASTAGLQTVDGQI